MNFLGHLRVAQGQSAEPSFHLGAMLPDFLSMARLRARELVHREVERGVLFHHATDAAFHAGSAFAELLADARRELARHDLARGSRRAASHVGIELLLDGWLARDAELCAAYRATLASELANDSRRFARWQKGGGHREWSEFRRRLEQDGLPEAYRDLDVLAARLDRTLARRPLLCLDDRARGVVRAWLARARARVEHRAEELLASAGSLGAFWRPDGGALLRPVQRRAEFFVEIHPPNSILQP